MAVEDAYVVVRLEGIGCDYHYSPVEVIQILR